MIGYRESMMTTEQMRVNVEPKLAKNMGQRVAPYRACVHLREALTSASGSGNT
jgi:hypothetical protein